jgi:hypothetical protein
MPPKPVRAAARCARDLAGLAPHVYNDFVVRTGGQAYCAACGWLVAEHPPGGVPPHVPDAAPQASQGPARVGLRGVLPPPAPDPWGEYRLRLDDIEVSLPYLPSHRDYVRACVRHVSSFVLNPEFMGIVRARFDGEGDLSAPMRRTFSVLPDVAPAQGGIRSACSDLETLGRHILGLIWCVAQARFSNPREAIPVTKSPVGMSSEVAAVEWILDRGAIPWDHRMARPPPHMLRSWAFLVWWGLNFALLLPEEWPEAFLNFTTELGDAYYQKNREFFTDRGTWQVKYSKEAIAAKLRGQSAPSGSGQRRRRFSRTSHPSSPGGEYGTGTPQIPAVPPPTAGPTSPLPISQAAIARRISSTAPQPARGAGGGSQRGLRSGRGRGRFSRSRPPIGSSGGRGSVVRPGTSAAASADGGARAAS